MTHSKRVNTHYVDEARDLLILHKILHDAALFGMANTYPYSRPHLALLAGPIENPDGIHFHQSVTALEAMLHKVWY